MRNLLLAGAALAAVLTATPALAQTNAGFIGPRVELQAGVRDNNGIDYTYGAIIGADGALNDRFTFGVDALVSDAFDDNKRVLGAGARLGYAVDTDSLIYVRGGYAHGQNDLDGYNAGAGFEVRLPGSTYLNTEYRYTNFDQGLSSHAALLGLGVRF